MLGGALISGQEGSYMAGTMFVLVTLGSQYLYAFVILCFPSYVVIIILKW